MVLITVTAEMFTAASPGRGFLDARPIAGRFDGVASMPIAGVSKAARHSYVADAGRLICPDPCARTIGAALILLVVQFQRPPAGRRGAQNLPPST